MQRQVPEASPVDDHDRKNCAGLNRNIEQIRTSAEPMLRYKQMPRARNRQELSDALDDTEQQNLQQTYHAASVDSTLEGGRIISARDRVAQSWPFAAACWRQHPYRPVANFCFRLEGVLRGYETRTFRVSSNPF